MNYANEYWNERVASGGLDWIEPSDLVEVTAEAESTTPVDLSAEDLAVIEEALRRYFIAIKRDRAQVLHAVLVIRKARERILD